DTERAKHGSCHSARQLALLLPSNECARVNQHHGRESRALEPLETRIGAVEEPRNPVSDSRARHDQMHIAVECISSHRLLQATGVDIYIRFDTFRTQSFEGRSYSLPCFSEILLPGIVVSNTLCLQCGSHTIFLFRQNEAINRIAYEEDNLHSGPRHFLDVRNHLFAPIILSQRNQYFFVHGFILPSSLSLGHRATSTPTRSDPRAFQ